MIWLIIGCAGLILTVYACLAAAGKADRAQEMWAAKLFDSDNGKS